MRLPLYVAIGDAMAAHCRVTRKRPEPFSGEVPWLGGFTEIAWNINTRLRDQYGSENVISVGDRASHHDLASGGLLLGWYSQALITSSCPCVPIQPWPNRHDVYDECFQWPSYRAFLDRAPAIIALGGDWSWQQSASDPVLGPMRQDARVRHINMGFSREPFPQIKTTFNHPGKRGVVYSGALVPWKRADKLVEALLGEETHLYVVGYEWGVGDHENVHHLGWVDNADQERWRWICERADFFAAAHEVDAQPHAPLECISRGLVPMLTPACNYAPCIQLTGVPAQDREVFSTWQHAPDEELRKMRDASIAGLAHYNWDRIVGEICDVLESIP